MNSYSLAAASVHSYKYNEMYVFTIHVFLTFKPQMKNTYTIYM